MGELSKTLGELGEDKVSYLMNLVGWSPNSTNISIECVHQEAHKEGIGPRVTHGIDALYRYECPLIGNHLSFVVVSAKNQQKYSAKLSTAKKYTLELINTISCFQESNLRKSISKEYKLNRKYSGVLFWLSDTEDDNSLIDKFADENIVAGAGNTFHSISLVDNKKANFLFNSIQFIKGEYSDYKFYYHNTGYNSSPSNRITSGSILPVEMINTGLIAFKASKNNLQYLIIATIEDYSEERVKRLISLCQNLTDNWAERVSILFNSYSYLENTSVDKVKLSIKDDDFTRKVGVGTFNQSLSNVEVGR